MKVYELMSVLNEAAAGGDVTVSICLSLRELMNGDQMDKDTYCLTLQVCRVEPDGCIIEAEI